MISLVPLPIAGPSAAIVRRAGVKVNTQLYVLLDTRSVEMQEIFRWAQKEQRIFCPPHDMG